jgi:hypothetical protein
MNTQNLLHERSADIPEGLYIDLMNRLKIDFESEKTKETKVIVINRLLPSRISMTKYELLQQIIKNSVDWADREEILASLPRIAYFKLKELSIVRGLPVMKENPRWVAQRDTLARNRELRDMMSRASPTPFVLNI